MGRVKSRIVQISFITFILISVSLYSLTGINAETGVNDALTLDWWHLDLSSYDGASMEINGPHILHLGPVRFDPIEWPILFQDLPQYRNMDLFLLQVEGPDSISPVLSSEGELFRIVDMISSDTILIDPIVGVEEVHSGLGHHIRTTVPYHPIFKIENSLYLETSSRDGEGAARVVIGLYSTPTRDFSVYLEDNAIGPIHLDLYDGMVEAILPYATVFNLASFQEVSHVSLSGIEWIDNDVAAGIIDVTEVSDVLGLNGTGQIVGVADTGLDTGSNTTLHQDFTGRVIRAYAYGRSGNWSDADIHTWDSSTGSWDYDGGHGTHVAGSVLGNGSASSGTYKGMAPAADLVMQSTMTSTGSLSIPPYSRLFGDAYRSGARIHTNSWSTRGFYGNYTWRSWQTDHFIWNNPDLVVLFSAGNKGTSGAYYVSTQASSKNVIAVGASENYRPTLGSSSDNISHMAYFSSQGPTWGDLRVKPDVVAPGTWILSTRSMLITDKWNHYWGNNATYSGVNNNYAYMGGTSMSTPIVAGMTTLARQYYEDIEEHAPSASLVKATVINGARPLNGQWSSIPNRYEGWGRVNLSNSLGAPGSDAGVMRYVDNSTGLTTGTTHSRLFTVASSNNDLVITLVWTDYPGSNTSSIKLLNDLDLKVTSPNGTVYNGNDFLSPHNSTRDSINNVERVVIPTPDTGIYKVNITGFSVTKGPQPYSFVISGNLSDAVGWVEWEEEYVPANGSVAHLVLSDSNLTGDGWINIKVNSSSDRNGEMINLTEVKKGSAGIGVFRGSVKIVTGTPAAGEVSVTNDEYITATYNDQFPSTTVVVRTRALIKPVIYNISHDTVGRTLTYMDKVTVTIQGTKGWSSWFDVLGLSGKQNIVALDDGLSPDVVANDGNYTGEFVVPNLVVGNYTLKGYLSRALLDPTILNSQQLVRINTNIPRKPNNLTVTVVPKGNTLRLDWDNPGDVNLMSYIIQRAPESGTGSGLPGTFNETGTTLDNRTYYVDDGLVDGELYFFRVSSFNILGFRSEPCPWGSGIPSDNIAPWFDLGGPPHQTVLSGVVELNYSTENDTALVIFEIAEDRNNDMIPDGPWFELLNDTTPLDRTNWNTEFRPTGIDEEEWFILRARVKDEVDNWNVSSPLARYSIDNTPPPFLQLTSDIELAVNVSVFHLTGNTEPGSSVIIIQDGSEIRSIMVDGNGDFEIYLELVLGVNEFSVQSFDEYGNGPTNASSDIYIVYDPYEPQAQIGEMYPVTSGPFILNGSRSIDIGPSSRLSGIWNYSWKIEFWDETVYLYGPAPVIQLTRPGIAYVQLTIADAASNSNSTTAEIFIIDDQSPTVPRIYDQNVLEDTTVELSAPTIIDNDPQVMEIGNFTWTFTGPDVLSLYGTDLRFQFITPGLYEVTLEVTDSGGNTGSGKFNMTVMDITTPVVDAGDDVTIIKGQQVTFTGSNSSDNDPDFPSGANFTWIIKGLDLVFYSMDITVQFDELGDYRVLLKVADAAGNNDLEEIMLHVVSDGVPPYLERIETHSGADMIGPHEIFLIEFDEAIDGSTIQNGIIMIGPSGQIIQIDHLLVSPSSVQIRSKSSLQRGKEYSIRITPRLKDLTGESANIEEFTYKVRPELILLRLNGINIGQVERTGMISNSSDLEIGVEFNLAVSLDMTLILEYENGMAFSYLGSSEDNVTVFSLRDIEPGSYKIRLNGTSIFGDPLKGDSSFTLTIEEERIVPIDPEGDEFPWWIVISTVSALFLIILLAIIIFIVKKKNGGNDDETPSSPPKPPNKQINLIPPQGHFGR